VTKVFLSQKGVDATREISRVWADLEKLTIANLTSEEQAQLVAIAEKIVPQMEKGPGGMEKTCG
jgi:DNA-binding MarR family transcriptional regulator